MKYCPDCGNELKEGAKFCNACGSNIAAERAVPQQTSAVKGEQVINLSAINIDKERISDLSNNYFTYFKDTLVHPSESFHKETSYNGIIQFVLLSFIQVLSFLFVSFDSYFSMTFGMFLGLFLTLTLFNFLSVFVVHGVKKFVYRASGSFLKTSTQYGGLFSSYVLLHTIIMLVTLFVGADSSPLAVISSLLSVVVAIFAFAIYLYIDENKPKLDKFYVGVIATLVLFLVWFIVLRLGSTAIISLLEGYMSDIMYGLF